MPTYEISAPDGNTYRIEGPAGATDEQVRSEVLKQHPNAGTAVSRAAPSAPRAFDPTEGMSGPEKVWAGVERGVAEVGRGIRQFSTLGPLNEAGRERQAQVQADIDESRRLDAPLMATRAGRLGSMVGQAAATAPAALIPGAGSLLGATAVGGGLGAIQPTATGESRAANIGLGAAGGAVGKLAGDVAAAGVGYIADKLGRIRPAAPSTEAGALIEQGYKLPPSYAKVAGAKPSALDDWLEGFGGKTKVEQRFSAANQANTNRLVRRALNLGEGETVTAEELAQVRADAGDVYRAVTQFKGRFVSDDQFERGLDGIVRQRTSVSSPERGEILKAPGVVSDLIEKLKGDYDPGEAIEMIKKLRADGNLEVRSFEPNARALGRAKLAASKELEGLIERNLGKDQGAAGLFQAYKQARTLIARSYDVEKALNKGTGNVSAVKLARLADKRPVGGELGDVVDFARKYGGAARTVEERGSRLGPEHSPLDFAAAAVAAAHHPAAAAALLARPLARRYLLSEAAQRGMLPQAAPAIEQQILPRAGAVAGATSLSGLQQPPQY